MNCLSSYKTFFNTLTFLSESIVIGDCAAVNIILTEISDAVKSISFTATG